MNKKYYLTIFVMAIALLMIGSTVALSADNTKAVKVQSSSDCCKAGAGSSGKCCVSAPECCPGGAKTSVKATKAEETAQLTDSSAKQEPKTFVKKNKTID